MIVFKFNFFSNVSWGLNTKYFIIYILHFIFFSKGTEDPFVVHFEQDLEESAEKHLNDLKSWQVKTSKVSCILLCVSVFLD